MRYQFLAHPWAWIEGKYFTTPLASRENVSLVWKCRPMKHISRIRISALWRLISTLWFFALIRCLLWTCYEPSRVVESVGKSWKTQNSGLRTGGFVTWILERISNWSKLVTSPTITILKKKKTSLPKVYCHRGYKVERLNVWCNCRILKDVPPQVRVFPFSYMCCIAWSNYSTNCQLLEPTLHQYSRFRGKDLLHALIFVQESLPA